MFKKCEARPLLVFFGAVATVLFFISGQIRPANAVTVTTEMSGNLVKGSSSTVYFVGSDNKRYIFPNENVFYSWYADFSTVKIITDDELAVLPIGGDVIARAATRLLKGESDPKVYALSSDGILQWVSTEALAQQLFGTNWAKQVEDVSDSELANYQTGNPITSASDYNTTGGDQNQSATGTNNTATPAANQTENTNGNTNTPPASGTQQPAAGSAFKIISVTVDKVDALGQPAEDVRSFGITFNGPATGARLTIIEKNSGLVFYTEPIAIGTTSTTIYVSPVNWTAMLKPSMTYIWKIVAYAAPNATADQIATATGDFTTSDFTPAAATPAGTNTNTTPTNTNTPNSTAAGTTVDTASPFNIVSVTVDKVDALGQPAEDVRSFDIVFSRPPIGARLTIIEKSTGVVFYSNSIGSGTVLTSTVYVKPSDWTAKLEPNTDYTWKVTANAESTAIAGNPIVTDSATGDFTTSDFTPVTAPTADTNTNTPPADTTGANGP
jgi:hypothetical protein